MLLLERCPRGRSPPGRGRRLAADGLEPPRCANSWQYGTGGARFPSRRDAGRRLRPRRNAEFPRFFRRRV